MSARHSSSRPRRNPAARRVVLVGGAVVVVVLLVGLVVALVDKLGKGGMCGSHDQVTLAVEPTLEEQARQLADRAGDDSCYTYSVEALSSSAMSQKVARREGLPDLWIPDSAVRLAQTSQDVQVPFTTVLNSVASTPVVIASRNTQVDMSSWTAALGTKGLKIGDPTRSGTADAPILAATSEVESGRSSKEAVGASMAALAQGRAGRDGTPPDDRQLLEQLAATGGAAVVTEQQGVAMLRDRPDSGIVLGAPRTGAVYLTYPLAVVTQDPGRRETACAADALRDAVTGGGFHDELARAGFRGADRAPLADGAGVGDVPQLAVRDAARVDATLQRWRLLSMPSRSLVAIDTSGSMSTPVEGTDRNRIGLLLESAMIGVGQFPNDASIGLWAFGGTAGTAGKPYQELGAVEKLSDRDGAGTHRQALGAALQKAPSLVGGGTDLYQTVLDAYQDVQAGYDPDAVNSVIVISDGANDNVSSMSKEDFLTKLRVAVDPARPVIIVTVGIMEDADPATLNEIAKATGGNSHIARTAGEIPRVFAQAIMQRGQS